MSKEKRRVPKLRFPGFTEDWEQRKLGDLMEVTSVKRIHQADWTDSGVRFFRARDIVSSMNNEEIDNPVFISKDKYEEYSRISGKVIEGDLLVTGVGTIGVPYLIKDTTPLYFKDGNIIWFKNNNTLNGSYFYYCFQNSYIQNQIYSASGKGTVGTYTIENGKKTSIRYPSLKEQIKIGNLLDTMTTMITLHQRKLEHLNLKKKAFLQKLFPKNGERYPELRFPGFTDAREQRKFSDLYEKISEKNDLSYSLDKIISVANMYYKSDAKVSNEEYLKTYNIFRYGEIAFEGNKSKDFTYGRFVENTIGDGIISHVFEVFRPITKYDIYFWKYYINYEPIMGKVLSRCTKKTTMMTNLVAKDFLKETVLVPSLAEQKRIGILLNTLDKFITLHQRKLEHLQLQKKALLQQMFV